MSQPSNTFNRFGAKVDKFLALFPSGGLDGLQVCDFNGENAILQAQAYAASLIASMLRPDIKNALFSPKYQLVVRPGEATEGQTTWTVPFTPIVDGSYHFWRRPLYQGYYNDHYGDYYDAGFWSASGEPRIGANEIPKDDITIDLATGACTLGGSSSPLTECEQVIASYRVDVNSTSYEVPSVADWVNDFAAAQLGTQLFDRNSPLFSLVESLQKKVVMLTEMMQRGQLIPAETLYERFYYETERSGKRISSIQAKRT